MTATSPRSSISPGEMPVPDVTRTASLARAAAPYLESWLDLQRSRSRTPGVQAAIRVGGEVVLSTALGTADVSTGEPLTEEHLFRIASHSKTFTATAVLQLVEAGLLRLDDPVAQWVPQLQGTDLAAVTVRELLGHQGGVVRDGGNGASTDFWQLRGPFPDEAALLASAVAVYGRNEMFKYSNVAYSLLGMVVAAASGRPYATYVTAEICERLGLRDTSPEHDPARAAGYAAGHTGLLDDQDSREVIPHVDTRAMAAATGFSSTALDLTAYGAAHCAGSDVLLREDSKRLMQRQESVVMVDGEEVGRYGLGLDLRRLGERELVGHSGGYPGHITRTWVDPRAQVVVSVLTNAVDGPADSLARGLLSLLDLALAGPADRDGTGPAGPDLDRFTGRFANLWSITDVAQLGGRLLLLRPTDPDPREHAQELDVVDPSTLRLTPRAGFGPVGEDVRYAWAGDAGTPAGHVEIAGMTSWPLEAFRARRTRQLAEGS